MARKASKSGIKKRLKRRVKALRPVEAPLMSKAKTDDPKAQKDNSPKGDDSGKPSVADRDDSGKAASDKDAKQAESDKDAKQTEAKQAEDKSTSGDGEDQKEQPSRYAKLLHPRELPKRSPDEDAPAPGLAPPGDSRSFRRRNDGEEEFCLIYRLHRELVVRRGPLGKWGEVEVTQYPSDASAATAYAHACSDLAGEGFYDLRE